MTPPLSRLAKLSPARSAKLLISYGFDYLYDIRNGTETCSRVGVDDLEIDLLQRQRAVSYQPTHVLPLRHLLKRLRIPPGKVLLDLGCGKGRVLLVASEFGFREARGVDVSPVVCDVALRNCRDYAEKRRPGTRFCVFLRDVLDYDLSDDEDVFFMYNPFDAFVFDHVFRKIKASVHRQDRKIWIVYCNALYRHIIEGDASFTKLAETEFLGQGFAVYTNRTKDRRNGGLYESIDSCRIEDA